MDSMEESFDYIELLAAKVVRWATASHVLILIAVMLLVWIVFGPIFGFSIDWQSMMTVPTMIITFVLVFFILRAQSKDTKAIQMKLNEIIASQKGANNALIDIENQSEQTIEKFHHKYEAVAQHVKDDTKETSTDAIVVDEIADEAVLAEGLATGA